MNVFFFFCRLASGEERDGENEEGIKYKRGEMEEGKGRFLSENRKD